MSDKPKVKVELDERQVIWLMAVLSFETHPWASVMLLDLTKAFHTYIMGEDVRIE